MPKFNLMKQIAKSSLAAATLLIVGCNSDSFSPATGLKATAPTSGGTGTAPPVTTPTLPPQTCTQSCSLPNGTGTQSCGATSGTCTLTICNAGYVDKNGSCVELSSTSPFQCTSYAALTLSTTNNQLMLGSSSVIPAPDPSNSGVCYYYALNTQSLGGASYQTGTAAQDHDQTVISRDHDVNTNNISTVWHPYKLLHSTVNITLAASRIIQLVGGGPEGSTFNSQTLTIDNFFLIGIYPSNVAVTPANARSYYSAYGTGDSTVIDPATGNSTEILFNPAGIDLTTNSTTQYTSGSTPYSSVGVVTKSSYAAIPLVAESPGGTAVVPQVQCTNEIQPNVQTTIDFRALDCGAGRTLTPIYLIVQ